MIKVVIFDIDGVLIDSLDDNTKFFQDLMRAAGYKPPTKKEYARIFHLTMWDAIHVLTRTKSTAELKRIFKMGIELPYATRSLKVAPQARATIRSLVQRYKVAVVTNRVREGIDEIADVFPIRKLFPVVITFESTRNHKPHPAPLLLAAKRLRVKPSECVYVGDAKSDLLAGHAAGMKVVMYTGYSKKRLPTADATISSLGSLPQIVARL